MRSGRVGAVVVVAALAALLSGCSSGEQASPTTTVAQRKTVPSISIVQREAPGGGFNPSQTLDFGPTDQCVALGLTAEQCACLLSELSSANRGEVRLPGDDPLDALVDDCRDRHPTPPDLPDTAPTTVTPAPTNMRPHAAAGA